MDVISPDPGNSMTAWCAGLPLTARRLLDDAEQNTLRAESRRHYRNGCLGLPVVPILFLAMLAAFALHLDSDLLDTAGKILMLACLAAVGLTTILVRDALRSARLLSGDLRAGVVMRFEGTLDEETVQAFEILQGRRIPGGREFAEPDAFLLRLLEWGLLHPSAHERQSLEILPVSGRVWRVNEQPPGAWLTAVYTVTAETPEFAAIASQWLEPMTQTPDGSLRAGQRTLSPAELEELRTRIRDAWRRPFWPALLLSLWFLPLLAVSLWQKRLPPESPGRFVILGLTTLLTGTVFLRGLRRALRLRRDRHAGFVRIARVLPTDGGEQWFEFLPFSGILWTEEGLPAGWRRQTGS